jgi:hypothetical protein
MAFTPDGEALWVARKAGVEVLSWPDLRLVRVLRPPARARGLAHRLAFDPTGALVAVTAWDAAVSLLSLDGECHARLAVSGDRGARELKRLPDNVRVAWPRSPVLAVELDADGHVYASLGTEVVRLHVESNTCDPVARADDGATPPCWCCLILRRARVAFFGSDDRPATVVHWDSGARESAARWMQGGRGKDGNKPWLTSGWLGAAARHDELAVAFGCKDGSTAVAWLTPDGRPEDVVPMRKVEDDRPEPERRPHHSIVHALHPQEPTLVFRDVAGRLNVYNALSGEPLDLDVIRYPAGYY